MAATTSRRHHGMYVIYLGLVALESNKGRKGRTPFLKSRETPIRRVSHASDLESDPSSSVSCFTVLKPPALRFQEIGAVFRKVYRRSPVPIKEE